MHLTLALLGPYHAELNGRLITSRAKKIEALLVYLALEARQPLPRYLLHSLLFPDTDDDAARTNLRQTLARLQRAIQHENVAVPLLLLTRRTIQFNEASNFSLDVDTFWTNLAGCQEHQGQPNGRCSPCMAMFAQATALYRGSFLDGFFLPDNDLFEQWLQQKRDHLQSAYLTALGQLANYEEQNGRYAQADAYLRQQLAVEPWQEATYQQRMRLLARQGKRSEALTQYKLCRQALVQELGVEPTAVTQALFNQIRQTTDVRPHQLPLPSQRPFIGRPNEITQLQQRLAQPEQRLITLVGTGGIGKTTLAIHLGWSAVHDYLGPFTHGIFFIELAATGAVSLSQDSLATAVAHMLQLPLNATQPPLPQLVAALRRQEILLIVDNGEQLGAVGRGFINTLLQQTEAIKCLVTSRERLRLPQEWVLTLDGLPYPPEPQQRYETAVPPSSSIATYAAIRLFLARGQQAHPNFAWQSLTQQEQTAVIHLSQLTQGHPLALELAAAWVHTLSCQTIAAEIRRNLDLLTQTDDLLPPRHQSITAVFEYSWQRLTTQEQHSLAQLSVFRGQFSQQAAEQVVSTTIHLLTSLVNKSLLRTIPTAQGPRFALHPLLRQFASRKLQQQQQQQIEQQHAHYYGRFLQTRLPNLNGQATETLAEIQTELDNVRAGWHWAVHQEEVTLLGQYLHTLHQFYSIRGWFFEARDLFQLALPLKPTQANISTDQAPIFAALLSSLAGFHYELSHINEAESLAQEAIQLSHLAEEPTELIKSYTRLVRISQWRGDYAQAQQYLIFMRQIANDEQLEHELISILMLEGASYRDQGDHEAARQAFIACLTTCRRLGDQWGEAHTLRLLATAVYQLGDQPLAHHYMQQSRQLWQQLQNEKGEALLLIHWGELMQADGRLIEAEQLYRQGWQQAKNCQDKKSQALALENLGKLMADQGACEQARHYYYEAFETAVSIQDLPHTLNILLGISKMLLQTDANQPHDPRLITLLTLVDSQARNLPPIRQQVQTLLHSLPSAPEPPEPGQQTLADVQQIVASLLHPIPSVTVPSR